MATENIHPRADKEGYIGLEFLRWLGGCFATLNVDNGNKAPLHTLQRETTYALNDVTFHSGINARYFLKCTTAGTTGSEEPDFSSVTSDSTVSDGTAVWTVSQYAEMASPTFTGTLSAADIAVSGDASFSGDVNIASADKAPINTLQRSTAYAVGDIIYTSELHAKYFLKCTTAGTTDSTAPSFSGAGSGDTITDGTAVWTVQTILSLEEQESKFVDDLLTGLQTTGSLPAGTAFGATTLLSKIISQMNTDDGVQYNFTNANAWYICLGAKYGGLIIQGGTILTPSGNYGEAQFPITFSKEPQVFAIPINSGAVTSSVTGTSELSKAYIHVYDLSAQRLNVYCCWLAIGT